MTQISTLAGFHGVADWQRVSSIPGLLQSSEFTYSFENFFHPFTGELIQRLNRGSVAGLLAPETQGMEADFFAPSYTLPPAASIKLKHSPKNIDLEPSGPYANYNWELFFHIPFAIAVHLSKSRRFREAQRWFHFIFDPTADDDSAEAPQRYWKFAAFRREGPGARLDRMMKLLSASVSELSDEDQELRERLLQSYEQARAKPFQPHAVARTRPLAYMYAVVMKYLDNLIAWGDSLFRQDTIETINEATNLYVMAANILGRRPERIPTSNRTRPKTFAQLRAHGLDPLGNALVELEGLFPFNPAAPSGASPAEDAVPLAGIGRTLYFCIPHNEKLLGYWDTVGDRLFKLRHCMNIEGKVRQLALFEPPLDPAMMAQAAAAGIDVGSIVAGLNQPASPVRAQFLMQKALEIAGEVRSLGSSLLQAIEKTDGERLTLLRQKQEIKLQEMQQEIRFLQWKQTESATESLRRSWAAALERYKFYLGLLGQEVDSAKAPDELGLNRAPLTQANFAEVYGAYVGQYEGGVPLLEIAGPDLADADELGDVKGSLALTSKEAEELHRLRSARDLGRDASIVEVIGTALAFIPDPGIDLHYWGLGGNIKMNVGTAITKGVEIASRILQIMAAWERDQAGLASRTAGYERRANEWALQANAAAHELRQLGRQVISSLIAEQVARHEYEIARKQIEHSREVDQFLHEKFSNADLYAWMQGELSRIYYDYYRFAFDTARLAERTMKRELMRPDLDGRSFLKFNYWDSGRKGLLAGEALHLDLKRLELAYHESNRRQYELTKHVSLLQVDPLALIRLRATGRCTVRIPESVFDMDGPGQYFRRIRDVAITVPAVAGPYVGVSCKLTLLSSRIRTSPSAAQAYEYEGPEDDRFQDFAGALESVVASSGQQDGGLFDGNARDERYLPFENSGAISEWRLELPADPSRGEPAQFDYNTISDVILHIRYTAREGGEPLRKKALAAIDTQIVEARASGSVRLFSIRHEFPSEWARFKSGSPALGEAAQLTITPRPEHYPFWSRGRLDKTVRIDLFARGVDAAGPIEIADAADLDNAAAKERLIEDASVGNLFVGSIQAPELLPATPTDTLAMFVSDQGIEDLFVAWTWQPD